MITSESHKPDFSSIEIKANYTCNSRCAYCCSYNNQRKRTMRFDEIDANVRYFLATHPIEEVCLSGGEPTIHPDFLSSLQNHQQLGLRTYLHSNGIRFANRSFARSCQGLIDRTLVGFTYHDEALCAQLTHVTGSFAQRIQGIENLQQQGIPVRTNTVILRENLPFLPQIAATICSLGITRALFTLPFFFFATPDQVEQFVPEHLDQLFIQLAKVHDTLQTAGIEFFLQGLPPCQLREFARYYEIDPDRAFIDSDHQFGNHTFLFSGMLGYRQGNDCSGCGHKERCWGMPRPGAMDSLTE